MQATGQEVFMIVDDEDGIRAVLQALLESIQIESLEARDAHSAVATLTANKDRITACLLDMNLEDAFGEDVYDQLKAISPELRIYAMSGIYGDEIRERLGDRKVAGLIPKPFSAAELIQKIENDLP